MTYIIGIWTLFLLLALLLCLRVGGKVILDGQSPLIGKLIATVLLLILGPTFLFLIWRVPLTY